MNGAQNVEMIVMDKCLKLRYIFFICDPYFSILMFFSYPFSQVSGIPTDIPFYVTEFLFQGSMSQLLSQNC